MKRLLAILLCTIFTLGLVLTGCGAQQNTGETTAATNESSTVQTTEAAAGSAPGTFPLTKEKQTFRIMTLQLPSITDMATNNFTKFYEDKTNVHIKWELIPESAVKDKISLTLASGSFPDAFMNCKSGNEGITPNVEFIYGQQEKVFVPLESYINNAMPELKKILDAQPAYVGQMTSPDGHIYSLPVFSECYHCNVSNKMWVNQKWLDKLGIKQPTTTEEFYQMLKAFKENDPNGNGKKDEIPMAGSVKTSWHNSVELFLLNAFLPYDLDMNPDADVTGFYLKDGKITASIDKPEYKEGLKYMNKLYAEGLIYPGSFSQDNTQLTALVENPDAGLVGAIGSGYGGMFAKVGGERYREFQPIAPLKGPAGFQHSMLQASNPSTGEFVITNSCKNPELLARWADWFYSFDGTINIRYGFEGESWKKPDAGEIGLDGNPASWHQLKPWNDKDPQNLTWIRLGVYSESSEFRLGQAVPEGQDILSNEGLEKFLYDTSKNLMMPYTTGVDSVPTTIRFLKEEQDQLAALKVEYSKYIRAAQLKFITGKENIDSGWDQYIKDLEKLQLAKIIEYYQTAYDRQFAKK